MTRRNAARKSVWRRILTALSIVDLILLVALYVFESRVAERHWLGTVITYAPQHLYGIPAAILVLWSTAARDLKALAMNLAACWMFLFGLLGFCVPWRTVIPHRHAAGAPPARQLRVMTYNIHHSREGGTAVADVVRRAQPDIIFLQEASPIIYWSNAVNEIRKIRGTRWYVSDYGELATISKYPIVSTEICRMESCTGRILLRTVLDLGDRKLTLINVHLNSSIRPRSITHDNMPIPDRVRAGSAVRSVQVNALLDVVHKVDGPLIVAGDFNTPPRGVTYRRIKGRLGDAFSRAGWGLGYTYKSTAPVLRIDYIFTSSGIRAKHCEVIQTEASDHRPVVADLEVGG